MKNLKYLRDLSKYRRFIGSGLSRDVSLLISSDDVEDPEGFKGLKSFKRCKVYDTILKDLKDVDDLADLKKKCEGFMESGLTKISGECIRSTRTQNI